MLSRYVTRSHISPLSISSPKKSSRVRFRTASASLRFA